MSALITRFCLTIFITCILDFIMNSIFEPTFSTVTFNLLIISMAQMLTLLSQFFAWYFLISSRRSIKFGGHELFFNEFSILLYSTIIYVFFFIIYKIILFEVLSDESDLFDVWNHFGLITMWSSQRIVAVVHYCFTFYYTIKIILDPSQFL